MTRPGVKKVVRYAATMLTSLRVRKYRNLGKTKKGDETHGPPVGDSEIPRQDPRKGPFEIRRGHEYDGEFTEDVGGVIGQSVQKKTRKKREEVSVKSRKN